MQDRERSIVFHMLCIVQIFLICMLLILLLLFDLSLSLSLYTRFECYYCKILNVLKLCFTKRYYKEESRRY
jgi:hypothetical protein